MLPAMEDGTLPNLKSLSEVGKMDATSTAIFPSITHAALASLATGCYPRESGIPGSYWFEAEDNQVVHYIDDIRAILNRGMGEYMQDIMVDMNRHRLRPETIFEIVERTGFKAACVNHLIHRGLQEHEVNLPLFAKLLPSMSRIDTVGGPAMLYMGDLVRTPLERESSPLPYAGLMRRYGLDDQFSADMLLHLAENRVLPAVTITYFMDNDYESHIAGPQNALKVLEQLDGTLGRLFDLYGGIEATLNEFCVIITGDHAQSNVANTDEEAAIVLDELLAQHTIAPIGQSWTEEQNLIVCPNMRTAQIYAKQPDRATIGRVTEDLLADSRVDQVMWRASLLAPDATGYMVITRDRGHLHFWPGSSRSQATESAHDEFGCLWNWSGELGTIDAEKQNQNEIKFASYPNAFERIACALDSPNGGHVWATARLGAEFQLQNSTVHTGGGSHASLHMNDSHVPLLMAGMPDDIVIPSSTRTVDVLPLSLAVLGINAPRQIGASHVVGA